MTTSRRLAERKIAKFEKNITRRGSGSGTSLKKMLTAENIAIAFFISVIVGSFLYQMIRLAMAAE